MTLVWWHNATQGEGAQALDLRRVGVPQAAPRRDRQGRPAPERAVHDEDPDRPPVGQPARRLPELGRRPARRPGQGGQGRRPDEVRQAVDQVDRRLGRRLAGQRQAVRHPVQRRRGGVLVQQEALRAGRYHDAAEDLAAAHVRDLEAQGGGHRADRDRLEGQVAGRLLLGLPCGQALQQAGDPEVGRDLQLQQPVLGRRRASTRSNCSTPSPSRTASSRPRRSRARRARPAWSRTARPRWSSRATGTRA